MLVINKDWFGLWLQSIMVGAMMEILASWWTGRRAGKRGAQDRTQDTGYKDIFQAAYFVQIASIS